jgi:hypothetical protein
MAWNRGQWRRGIDNVGGGGKRTKPWRQLLRRSNVRKWGGRGTARRCGYQWERKRGDYEIERRVVVGGFRQSVADFMRRRGVGEKTTRLRACTVVFNVEALKVFKGVICKKILEPSLREETPLARKPSSNRRLTFHCTNLSSVLSI